MGLIDLHIHSCCSDGVLTPFEIVDQAKKNHVDMISITDHDCIDAYTPSFLDYARKKDISVVYGVEISTHYQGVGFHVLGYQFDLHNPKLNEKLYTLKNARHIYLKEVSKKLKELGYIVHVGELSQFKIVTKAHIASHIVQNKENEKLLLHDFGYIPQRGEFIETLMNEGCPAYVKKESITPMEASQLIKEAGGIVVLAHPVCYEHEDHINVESITHLVKEMNADGIEAIYMYIDQKNNKINDIEKWKNFALKNHLLYTMGSDFHMDDGIHPQIGLINEQVYIQNNDIQWLKKKMIGV